MGLTQQMAVRVAGEGAVARPHKEGPEVLRSGENI